MIHVIVVEDYEAMSLKAAQWLAAIIGENSHASMVLAMGNTPMGMYANLTELQAQGEVNCSNIQVFQLDGYLGISGDDPRSLEGWLRRSVVEPWKLREDQLVLLDEQTNDPDKVVEEYVRRVQAASGFDVAVLGLGPNGHLGFNEPPSRADSPTRAVTLTRMSIKSNAAYWGDESLVPRESITAGMDVLLASKRIVLLVSGSGKREILRQTLRGEMHDGIPSSFLRTHPDLTIIADKAAWSPEEVTD